MELGQIKHVIAVEARHHTVEQVESPSFKVPAASLLRAMQRYVSLRVALCVLLLGSFVLLITLDSEAAGTLKLGNSDLFDGVVSGFNDNDVLDLTDIDFGVGPSVDYVANEQGTGGTLAVSDGVDWLKSNWLGQYDAAGFSALANADTGTLIEYVLTGLTPTT